MKKKAIIILCVLVVLAGAAFAAYRHYDRRSMIDCTLQWGRLAPFPAAARDFSIRTEGGFFTRAFRAQFAASPEEIEQWVRESPGTSGVQPERPSSHIRRYQISPGGGAQHAEVEIDDQSHIVSVYVYWS
jgi:hypothetical protein